MIVRQSNLMDFPVCRKKFLLGTELRAQSEEGEWETDAQRDGLLFEYFVLGSKPTVDEEEYFAKLKGRKHQKTLDAIQKRAENVKSIFVEGERFVTLDYEYSDLITLKMEADFVGKIVGLDGKPIKCIADLKHTSGIERLWNNRNSKMEFPQAVFYPYIYFQKYGEILPFVYVIVEGTYDKPDVKLIRVDVDSDSFQWLEDKLLRPVEDAVLTDNFEPNISEFTCYSYYGKVRCPLYEHCKEAREYFSQNIQIDFNLLME